MTWLKQITCHCPAPKHDAAQLVGNVCCRCLCSWLKEAQHSHTALLPFFVCRAVQPITLRTGAESVAKHPAALPSDKNQAFTYGLPAAYRCGQLRSGPVASMPC
jgi:hypothetical protein